MGLFRAYFRVHRWQRRLLTLSAAVVLGLGLAALLYGPISDRMLLNDLQSDNSARRIAAIERAAVQARQSERTRACLVGKLDTPDDRLFLAVASALVRARAFDVASDPAKLDRFDLLTLQATRSSVDTQAAADSRWLILNQLIICGRDNLYVRRAAEAAAKDPAPTVRAMGCALAARFGMDQTLRSLLSDAEPSVVASAALDAGLAGRTALTDAIVPLIRADGDVEIVSSAAYSLALLAPAQSASLIDKTALDCPRADLRDRLLHVQTMLGGPDAGAIVFTILSDARDKGELPPAAALLAAGKLHLRAAQADVVRVLNEALRPGARVSIGDLRAALAAAQMLDLPVRRQAYEICRDFWGQNEQISVVLAARLLGAQAARPQDDPQAPTTEQCMALLHAGVEYYRPVAEGDSPEAAPPASRPSSHPSSTAGAGSQSPDPAAMRLEVTPAASAAAAVVLWQARDPAALDAVRHAADADADIALQYIAWHVATEGPDAWALGETLLPPRDAPPSQREYDTNLRACGAMLLALAAQDQHQRQQAAARIAAYLEGPRADRLFQARSAYQCALAILGERPDNSLLDFMIEGNLPVRGAMTALIAAGRREALDWMLSRTTPDDRAVYLLLNQALCEVLAAEAPSLPRVDFAAWGDLLHWQTHILKETWAIHRNAAPLGPPGTGATTRPD